MTGWVGDGFEDDECCDWPSLLLSAQSERGDERADDWPLRAFLKLGAVPGSVPCVRRHARHVVREWGFGEFGDAIELVVSELATNAVNASLDMRESPLVRVWLLCDKARIRVLVWDGNPSPPVRQQAGEDAEAGRGLLLVEAFSEQWGWHAHHSLGGKITWCQVSVTGPPEPGCPHRGWPE